MLLSYQGSGSFRSATIFKDINLIATLALANMQTTIGVHSAKSPVGYKTQIRLETIHAGMFMACKPFLSYFEALLTSVFLTWQHLPRSLTFLDIDGPDR